MSENKNIKKYSAEDIERYQRGEMSAQERNALEKAALNDPFLSDALEGFMDNPVPVAADIEELRTRLGNRLNEKSKLVTLAPRKSNLSYWRIAAVLLIMMGAGWFFYQYSGVSQNKTPIAVNDNTITPDSATVITEPTATPIRENKDFKKDTGYKKSTHPGRAADTYTWEKDQAPSKDQPYRPSQAEMDARKNAEELERRKMDLAADQKEKAIAKTEAVSDSVAVTGYGTKKMAAPIARGNRDNINSSIPLMGWDNYRQYLKDSLRSPLNYNKTANQQFVELNFEVNDSGRPFNYQVISAFSKSAAEEAWRLVSQGPAWTPGKASLKIYF